MGTFDLQVGHRQIITRYFGICLPICENEIINTYFAAGIYIFKDDFLENILPITNNNPLYLSSLVCQYGILIDSLTWFVFF